MAASLSLVGVCVGWWIWEDTQLFHVSASGLLVCLETYDLGVVVARSESFPSWPYRILGTGRRFPAPCDVRKPAKPRAENRSRDRPTISAAL